MRTILLGIAGFFISGVFLIPHFLSDFEMPPEFYIYAPLSLMAIAVLTQIDGILTLKKILKSRQLVSENDALDAELKDSTEKLHNVKKAVTDYKSRLASLEKRLKETDGSLKSTSQEKQAIQEEAHRLKEAFSSEKNKAEKLKKDLDMVRETPASVDESALQFLSLLQEKGRFLDFLMDDVSQYQDQQVGAAARVVHNGCSGVLREYFAISPVREEKEGSQISLDENASTSLEHRLVGKVGSPPWKGRIVHRGWKTNKISLPERVQNGNEPDNKMIIAPAEVELS